MGNWTITIANCWHHSPHSQSKCCFLSIYYTRFQGLNRGHHEKQSFQLCWPIHITACKSMCTMVHFADGMCESSYFFCFKYSFFQILFELPETQINTDNFLLWLQCLTFACLQMHTAYNSLSLLWAYYILSFRCGSNLKP